MTTETTHSKTIHSKNTHPKKSAAHETTTLEENAMTTQTTHSKKPAAHHATHTTHAKESTAMPTIAASTVSPASTTSTAAPPASSASTAPSTMSSAFQAPPPADANIPTPPGSFAQEDFTQYKGVEPRKSEVTALPGAVADIQKFTDYAAVLGGTAPPYADLLTSFQVASLWSEMRTKSSAWDDYCKLQEGIAWTAIRAQTGRLGPAFNLAVAGNPAIAVRFPNLASLLGAKSAIALKAAATRAANKKAVADGKLPTHGKVGRQRKTAAAKAALAGLTTTVGGGTPVTVTPIAAAASPTPATPTSTASASNPPPAVSSPAGAPSAVGH